MRRREWLLGAAAGLASCRTAAPERAKVRVLVGQFLAMSPLYQTVESNHFAAYGLDVELVPFSAASAQAIPLMASGQAGVLLASFSVALYNAIAQGARLRAVAGRETATPACDRAPVLYVNAKSYRGGTFDANWLKGKRIALGALSISDFTLEVLARTGGLTPKDYVVVPVRRTEEMAPLLAAGKIDGLVGSDVDNHPAVLSGQIRRLTGLADHRPGMQYSHIYFGKALLDGEPSTGARFLRAYQKGVEEFMAGRSPRFMDELAKSNGLDQAAVRAMCRNSIVPDCALDARSFADLSAWAAAKGGGEPLPGNRFIDTRFLELAKTTEPVA